MNCELFEDRAKLIYDFPVYACDGDLNGNLKLSRILLYNQTAGEILCENYGLTYENMIKQGYTIVMSRCSGEFFRPVTANGEKLTFCTLLRRTKGVRIVRDTLIYDKDGTEIGKISLESACMDINERKIIRPSHFKSAVEQLDLEEPWESAKYSFFEDGFEFAGTREAVYSDIDYNKHVNNTVYCDIAMDFLGFDNYNKTGIKLFGVNFKKELRPGEKVSIYTKNTSQDRAKKAEVIGKSSKGVNFEFLTELW